MKIVVDEYPKDCSTCIFKEDNFSARKNHCNILHVDIGGINDVRFSHRCHEKFILFSDMMDQYNIEKNLEEFEKEVEAKKKLDEIIEKKSLNLKDKIETGSEEIPDNISSKEFKDLVDDFVKFGKENIEKHGKCVIVVDGLPKIDEEELKRQREEALSKASKGGFLDTGEVVSIGEEIRKIKDRVREMDNNAHHRNNDIKEEVNGDKTLTKEQAAEMMCENFGGLV